MVALLLASCRLGLALKFFKELSVIKLNGTGSVEPPLAILFALAQFIHRLERIVSPPPKRKWTRPAVINFDNEAAVLSHLRKRGSADERAAFVKLARQTLLCRARRAHCFNGAMFGEAAWDMLLALYVNDMSGPQHTVSDLIRYAGTPPTTALRWLDFLEKEGLILRRPHRSDGRVFLVELSDKGRQALDTYFSDASPGVS